MSKLIRQSKKRRISNVIASLNYFPNGTTNFQGAILFDLASSNLGLRGQA